jgi:sugar lactone lactonase YvrE
LKVYQGNVYFLKRNKLMKLVPGSNQPQEVYDPGNFRAKVESFAFTPQGDLYLASNDGFYRHSRGTNVYLCKKSGNSWEKPKMINNNKQLFDNPYFVPHDMEVDAKGNLYIRHYTKKDKNHNAMSIYKRSPKGKMKRFCAMGQIRHMSPRMYGLYIDKSGKVYVASGATRSIACFSPKGKLIWKTEFKSDQGPGSLPIRNPIGICTDSKGNVWVTDPSANRILCFDKNGKFLKSYGHFGTIDNQDADSFCYPEGIAVVKDDNGQEWLYVADVNNQRIKKFRIMFDK